MNYTEGVEAMLKSGKCDVNYVNENGDTALSVAVKNNNYDMACMLIEIYNADPDIGTGRKDLIRYAKRHGNDKMETLLNK